MFLTSLALASLAAPLSPPAPQDLLTPRLRSGEVLPTGDTLRYVEFLAPNVGGAGYAAVLVVDPGARREIWADFVDDGSSAPQRQHQVPFAPFALVDVFRITATQNRIVWSMRQRLPGTPTEEGVYLDGTRIAGPGSPAPIPGSTWVSTPWSLRTTSGTMMYRGPVRTAPGGPVVDMIIEEGAPAPRVQVGDPIPGTSETIRQMTFMSVSPDGSHVLVRVQGSDFFQRLLLDGVPVELHGEPLLADVLLSSEARAILGVPSATISAAEWRLDVNDAGDWAADVPIRIPGTQDQEWVIRNGRLVAGSVEWVRNVVLTEDGVPVFGHEGSVRTGNGQVLRPTPDVDLDGDGSIDPGWTLQLEPTVYRENGSGVTYALSILDGPNSDLISAVVALPDRLPFRPICAGSPNGASLVGQLYAVGESAVADNELRLVAHGLPLQASGYALSSPMPAAPTQPPFSVGEICIGGPIGRYATSSFFTGTLGVGTTMLDLGAIPTPTGPAVGAPGDTWFFQVWYRDSVGGAPTSNFTGAIGVTLR
ncbi:MAG: hypothetical protein AAGB93_05295 [Planctomycetota bacterium]